MNNNKHLHRKLGVSLLAGVLFLLPGATALAAPGAIADAPLYTATNAPPNIMFMVDNSGSMQNVVAQSPYDSNVDYTPNPCGNSSVPLFPSSDVLLLRIKSGAPYAEDYNTRTYYALDKVCFNSTTIYYAELNASAGSGTSTDCSTSANCYPSGMGTAAYTGNYLNWYFSSAPDSPAWTTQRIKPTSPATETRSEIARAGAKNIIDGLNSSVNVGLATYDHSSSSGGADILVDTNPLTSAQKTTLDTAVDSSSLDPGGGTPLAMTLMDIGRYFLGTPSSTATFTLWPNSSNPKTVSQDTVFKHTFAAASGISTSASHIQYSCQKNFAVLLTDGQPDGDRDVVTSTYTGLTKKQLGDYDGDCANPPSGITCDDSTSSSTFDEKTGGGYTYQSVGSDYMDDVAKMLHDIDLYPSTSDPTINNLTTFMVGFADSSVANDPLLKETASNGGGQYLTAFSATQLNAAFTKATASILAMTSTASAVSFNTSTLQSNSVVYQGLFNTGRWSGDIYALPLNGVTGAVNGGCTLGTTGCWSAADELDAQSPSSRVIFTYNTSDSPPQGVLFQAPSDYASLGTNDIDKNELADLCAGPGIPNPESLANPCDTSSSAWTALSASQQSTQQTAVQTYLGQLVSYLRGDRSREGVSTAPDFRVRASVLGDIVDSSPAYVGVPDQAWPDQAPFPTALGYRYSDFVLTEQNRMPVIYAGANDGMLHAFDATTGKEIMAYVPSSVYSSSAQAGLHYLADPNYQHRYYVDGSPVVSDAYIYGRDSSGAETATKAWRTVLLGTLRGGGPGVFALDVTNPSQFSSANAVKQVPLWEFTSADDPELGQAFSQPTIDLMNNGRWAAVFGNGYNNGDTGGDGHAVLFIVYLDGGLNGSWSSGDQGGTPDDYITIDTGVGSVVSGGCTAAGSNCDGLSTPALADIDGNGTVDRIYAGDLLGNMWVFDVSSSSDQNWGVAYKKGQTPEPLFTAIDPSGNPQPITVQPQLAVDPTNTNNLVVVFGTGQYLTSADPSNTNLQSMYGVYDVNAMVGGNGKGGLTRSDLVQQTLTPAQTSCGVGCTYPVRLTSNTEPSNTQYGWYFDLETGGTLTGERVVVNPLVINGIVLFNSLIPDTNMCSPGGSGWTYAVKAENGGPADAPVLDVNRDGVVDASDVTTTGLIPSGMKHGGWGILTAPTVLSNKLYNGGSSCPPGDTGPGCHIYVSTVDLGQTQGVGRYSWRELRPPQ